MCNSQPPLCEQEPGLCRSEPEMCKICEAEAKIVPEETAMCQGRHSINTKKEDKGLSINNPDSFEQAPATLPSEPPAGAPHSGPLLHRVPTGYLWQIT